MYEYGEGGKEGGTQREGWYSNQVIFYVVPLQLYP